LQSGHSQAHIIRRRSAESLFVTAGRAGYRFKQAHEKASQRRKASDKPRKMTPDLVELIEEQEQWSPDQISGRLAKDGAAFISHERIYQHVWKDKKDGGACARVLLPLADRIETITYDRGKEFASHVEIATSLGSLSYFAKPYHSWERGLNEHTNGLFRQYFPKGSDLSIVSVTDVQMVGDKLNSRPRKILGYRTPRGVFFNVKYLPVALRC
jgi:IS30 family transposase